VNEHIVLVLNYASSRRLGRNRAIFKNVRSCRDDNRGGYDDHNHNDRTHRDVSRSGPNTYVSGRSSPAAPSLSVCPLNLSAITVTRTSARVLCTSSAQCNPTIPAPSTATFFRDDDVAIVTGGPFPSAVAFVLSRRRLTAACPRDDQQRTE